MIKEAIQHCPGVGPVRLSKLHQSGVRTWADVLDCWQRIPDSLRGNLIDESRRCLEALKAGDIQYFVDRFAPQDKWRILAHYLDQASYFDIETAGLENDSPITVIVCWHKGQLLSFVEHENLDDFLHLLDDVTLLVSFNGSSFDVPRILDVFHIPELPCPHVDLRWLLFHRGIRGGLKDIAKRMAITRPADLCNVDGEIAVQLWSSWMIDNDQAARDQLIRYCGADVVLLVILAHRLVGRFDVQTNKLWSLLPSSHTSHSPTNQTASCSRETGSAFGCGSPSRLRARRIKRVG